MSLRTWRVEFYPVEATIPKTALDAARHSLQKWSGLRPERLEAHGLTGYHRRIGDLSGDSMDMDVDTCALCQLFYETNLADECEACPLMHTLGHPCDSRSGTAEDASGDWVADGPYTTWVVTGDPEPMIEALRTTVERLVRAGYSR